MSKYKKRCPEPTLVEMGNEEEKIQNLNCFLKKINMVKWLRAGLKRKFIPNSRFTEKLCFVSVTKSYSFYWPEHAFAAMHCIPL